MACSRAESAFAHPAPGLGFPTEVPFFPDIAETSKKKSRSIWNMRMSNTHRRDFFEGGHGTGFAPELLHK